MAQENSTAPTKKTMTKAEFVLAKPLDMPVAEVVKSAGEAGLTITPGHVATIRSNAKRAAKKSSAPREKDAGEKKAAKKAAKPRRAKGKGKKSAAAKRGTKSEFIRSFPATMPAAEVIQKAKEAGITVTPDLVRAARSRRSLGDRKAAKPAKQQKAKAPKQPKTKAPKRAAAKPKISAAELKDRRAAQAAFILAQPPSMSATEVVEKAKRAKKAGLTFNVDYVNEVRAAAKNVLARPAPEAPKAAKKAAAAPAKRLPLPAKKAGGDVMTPEMVFARLALDIGLQKAKNLLTAVEDKLAGLVAAL